MNKRQRRLIKRQRVEMEALLARAAAATERVRELMALQREVMG